MVLTLRTYVLIIILSLLRNDVKQLMKIHTLVSLTFPLAGFLLKEAIMQNVIVPVSCPCCRNSRLFDIDLETEGHLQIKCPMCRAIVKIIVHDKIIHTEQIGA